MSILDQLRKEADEKKNSEQQQVDLEQLQAQRYKTEILPKMQEIFKYMQELVKYLNYLDVPVQVKEYSSRYPQLGSLMQKDYRISTDSFGGLADIDKLKHINITFYCEGEGTFEYVVRSKTDIEKEIAFLHSKRLSNKTHRVPGHKNEDILKFLVLRKIPVRLRFEVDYEKSLIKVIINNYSQFSIYTESWQAEAIDHDFLDAVTRYLLRKDSEFIKPDITDEERNSLRKKLAKIKKTEQGIFW
ncbi:hypothetical protein AU255_03090 [Methyloprofundus sedimenti]|uniref:Uncharacterized protein n=1 Tax=Methyloprofundus sedimenti TaxID=1420851 RepID=A0A1V8M690_9GAMM|nr:hypothetical protein [Methyloprofundus sedimenti]OQK16903.1 hypothetical protein AU255_03090 [Methyloprofundus sedimenti]